MEQLAPDIIKTPFNETPDRSETGRSITPNVRYEAFEDDDKADALPSPTHDSTPRPNQADNDEKIQHLTIEFESQMNVQSQKIKKLEDLLVEQHEEAQKELETLRQTHDKKVGELKTQAQMNLEESIKTLEMEQDEKLKETIEKYEKEKETL